MIKKKNTTDHEVAAMLGLAGEGKAGTVPAPREVPAAQVEGGGSNLRRKRKQTLDARQQHLLAVTVLNDADRLRREQPSLAEVAEQFGRKLTCSVSVANVKRAMKAVDVSWDTRRRRSQVPNCMTMRVCDGSLSIRFDRTRDDQRRCSVSLPQHQPPATSAAYLRHLADLLEMRAGEFTALRPEPVDPDEQVRHDQAERKLESAWTALAAKAAE